MTVESIVAAVLNHAADYLTRSITEMSNIRLQRIPRIRDKRTPE